MNIRMLGTGCGVSAVKKKISKDHRRSGGVIIDEKILIDAPGDIFSVAGDLGFSDMFDNVRDIFISHSHQGHFSNEALLKLCKSKQIRVFASDAVLSLIPDDEKIEKVELIPYLSIMLGDYKITPLPSNHETCEPNEICLNFIISRDKTLFYTLDSGFINPGAWKFISELKLDAVILDCALELSSASDKLLYHNNFDMVKIIRDIMLSSKVASPITKFILSHIPSSKKRSIHAELSDAAKEIGATVAYDGYFFLV